MAEIKEPTQNRAKRTRDLIATKGFQLILEKGFYNTTTNDIADECGLSVGVVYRYYKDKSDILHAGMRSFFESSLDAFIHTEDNTEEDVKQILIRLFNKYRQLHQSYSATHTELEALKLKDPVIAEMDMEYEEKIIEEITRKFLDAGMSPDHAKERVTVALGLMKQFLNSYATNTKLDQDFMEEFILSKVLEML